MSELIKKLVVPVSVILALIGEYLGRIQRDVEGSPLYTVAEEI